MNKKILIGLFLLISFNSFATIYYVRPSGRNANSGTSPSSAWLDLTNINNTRFVAGDIIYLEQGNTYSGRIYFDQLDGGTSSSPVIITSWNPNGALTGRATINAGTTYGFYGYNTAGVKITDLNFWGSNSNQNGVSFYCDLPNNVKKDFVWIEHLEVKGFKTGVSIGAWNQTSGFSNVTIRNVESHDNLSDGILTYAQARLAHTNVNISYCKTYNNLGDLNNTTNNTGSGIILGGVDGGSINHCIAYNNGQNNRNPSGGPVGIWCYESNNVIIEHNESYNNKAGLNADGGGFDIDGGSTNCIMQYNYSHGNEGAGYLFAQYSGASAMSNNIARYNISENDGKKNSYGAITLWAAGGHRIDNTQIYGNTVFVSPAATGSPSGIYIISGTTTGNTTIRNNIIVTTGGLKLINANSTSGLNFQGNNYWSSGSAFSINWGGTNYTSLSGFKTSGQESGTGIQADPMMNNPNAGITIGNTDNLTSLTAYQLKSGSPAIGAGVTITNPGSRDYFSNPLQQVTQFSIGAHQFSSDNVDTTPPSSPVLSSAGNTSTSVSLSWTASTDNGELKGYDIYNGTTKVNSSIITATTYTVTGLNATTSYTFTVRASDAAGNTSTSNSLTVTTAAASTSCSTTGDIVREYWSNVSGTSISTAILSSAPTGTTTLTSLEGPTDWGDNYQARIRAFITPATTGSYTFYIAGDDNSELWLSTDDNPSNKAKIASVSGWTSPRQWDKDLSTQRSTARTLNAGTKYYAEILHKEGGGGDNVAVGWTGPGISTITVIPGSVLCPYAVTPPPTGFSGTYKITARHSSKALDVSSSSTADGGNVQQWTANGTGAQQWIITATTNGYYKIVNKTSSKALEVANNDTSDGANVQQWSYTGANNQQWSIEATSDGFYKILNRHSGKALDVSGVSSSDGANVHQWNYVGGGNQQWKLEQLSTATARMASAEAEMSSEKELTEEVLLYPNPVTAGILTLELTAKEKGKATIELRDAIGARVSKQGYTVNERGNKIEISTSRMPAGLYTLIIQQGKLSTVKKIYIR